MLKVHWSNAGANQKDVKLQTLSDEQRRVKCKEKNTQGKGMEHIVLEHEHDHEHVSVYLPP